MSTRKSCRMGREEERGLSYIDFWFGVSSNLSVEFGKRKQTTKREGIKGVTKPSVSSRKRINPHAFAFA